VRKQKYISLQYISSVCADIWYDSISSRIEIEMKLYHTVSCRNELVRDAYDAGQTRIESLVWKHKYVSIHIGMHIMWDKQAEKCIIIVTIHIECFVQTNYMTAYRLEMKLYPALSCRNELVLDAYHAGHTSSESLVRKHNISLQYISSVSCRQITWQHIVSYRNQDEIVSYCMVSKWIRAGCISCGTHTPLS
jgi:hypothetical protein